MEMHRYSEIELHDVTKAKLDMLRRTVEADPGGKFSSGNSGIAKTPCFRAEFNFDPKSGVLILEPIELVKGLRGNRLKRIITHLMETNDSEDAVQLNSTTGDPEPTPHSCATYNWVIGYINNHTPYKLTYSGQKTNHGNIISVENDIPAEQTAVDQGNKGIFQNKSPKDSVAGCFGSVTWNIDGSTTMTIDYGVNTLTTTSATVSVSGPNSKAYTVSMDKRTRFRYACAYLYPTVTISGSP